MPEERLQKILARAGISSRRAAEDLIVAGRVSVDGKIVRELGTRADARRQRVEVDGRRLVAEPSVYFILNKPRGVMCTLSDPEGRETIKDLVRNIGARVVPVGRLDYHTSGALLLTNDGEFALKLQHPRNKVPKEYVAKVRGVLDEAGLARFAQSIEIDGRRTQPAEVRLLRVEGDKTWLSITLREGKNRQVRRLGDEAGHPVLRLSRLAHAGITTEGLRPGEFRALSRDELVDLKEAYGVPRRIRHPEPLPERASPRREPITRSAERKVRPRAGDEPRPRNQPSERSASGREPSRAGREPSRAGREPSRAGREPTSWGDRRSAGREVNRREPAPAKGAAREWGRGDPARGKSAARGPSQGERPTDRRARPNARSATRPAPAVFERDAGPGARPAPPAASRDRARAPSRRRGTSR